jgi:flavin reductase (DIM6/NTAB) family NADH-FMN oxidoreductase RutF
LVKILIDKKSVGANWYFMLHPVKAVLVTCSDRNGKPNVMSVGWNMPCSHKPWMVAIAVHPQRYSHKLISESKEFTVNVPTTELAYQTQFCGEYSGRDIDKFRESKLTARPGKKVKAPYIEECIAFMECKVAGQFETGDHTTFVGEIVYAEAEEDLIRIKPETRTIPDRYFDPSKCTLLYHLGADAYVTISPKLYEPSVPPPAKSWKTEQLKED